MRATQQLRYAIYGVFDLAYHGRQRPVPLQEIGERQCIPTRYLEQIFQRLRRAGLVRSKRGPGGGYLLARPPEAIALCDVVEAVQGCLLGLTEGEQGSDTASPAFVWDRIEAGLREALSATTIADLCRDAERGGMERAGTEPVMYEI